MAKRKSAKSPTQRTLAMLSRQGWTAAVTEHWNPFARVRQDLFGFIDILAIDGQQTAGFQVTSGSNVAARITKIRATQAAATWLASGNRLFVHGWRKSAAGEWVCREVEIIMDGEQ